jgi:hypothetical protein
MKISRHDYQILKFWIVKVNFSSLFTSLQWFAEHSSPENFSPDNSSPEDSSLEIFSPDAEDSSPEYSSPGLFFAG